MKSKTFKANKNRRTKSYFWKRVAVGALSVITILTAIPPMTVNADLDGNTFTVTQGNTSTAIFKHTHKHNGSQVTNAKVQSDQTISGYSASGLCYTEVHQHEHEGNTTTGGPCFTGHKHQAGNGGTVSDGGSTYYIQSGGCYTKKVSVNFDYITSSWTSAGGKCPNCGSQMNDDRTFSHGCHYPGCTHSAETTDRYCPNCGYNSSPSSQCYHDVYTLGCGKTESSYQAKEPCGFYTNPVYTLNCGISNGSVMARVDVRAENDNTLTYAVSSVDPHATVSRVWTVPAASKVNKNSDSFKCDVPGNYICTVTVTVTGSNGQTVESDTATFTYTAVAQNTTVNFVSDGSTFATRTMKNGSEDATVGIPEKTGYNFLGWYNGDTQIYSQYGNLKNAAKGFCPLNGGTVTLNAKFEPKSYNIRYTIVNGDLETETQINQSVLYDQENVKLEQAAKQYDGYTFLGFYHGDTKYFDTEGNYVETSGKWQRTENLAVVAKYQANTYTLNYNLNKEDPVGTQSQTITFDEDYNLTAEDKANRKEYKGYTFLGWIDDILGVIFKADGSKDATKWKYTQEVNAKATYEANKYTVTYCVENAAEESETEVVDTFTYDASAKLSKDKKEYPGWTFEGWYQRDTKIFNTDGTYVNDVWDIDENITVKPKFTPISYKLYYSLNKEEAVTAHSKTIPFNSAYGLSEADKTAREAYKGYTFLGWFNGETQIFDADGNNTDTGIWRTVGNVSAKATYEANPYTVTYYVENPVEEATTNHTDTFVFDTSDIKLSTAVKSYNGWTLSGFYNGSTKVFNADGTFVRDTWDIDENITVTPKWVPKEYTLNFSLNKEEEVTANTRKIKFNSTYGLTDEEKAARKSYRGYTFNGWYDGENLIFDADGNNTDTGVWRFLNTINAKATYTPNPYTVYYNVKQSDAPTRTLAVTFDADYRLPEGAVNEVPLIDGYTFDGWFDAEGNKIFNVNGTPTETPYNFDSDITVYVKYHKNKYTIHYNNGTVGDDTLDKSVVVTFDESYIDIAQAPYKPGYVFDGHSIKGTNTFIWDGKGSKTHAIWDFVCGVDGTEIDAVKNYSPKTFTVHVGDDFDNDGVIDGTANDYPATYDSAWFDLSVPAHIDGYTFDGYYLVDKSAFIATYASGTLTKESDTWVWDDNLNWNNDAHTGEYTLVRRWHKNAYKVHYNNTTVADTTLGQTMTVTYDTAYPAITQSPYKKGYIFKGHVIDGTDTYVWGEKGAAIRDTWTYVIGEDNEEVNVKKVYEPKVLTLNIGEDYNEDKTLDSVKETKTVTYDAAFTLNVPEEKTGLTFVGYYILGTDTCIASYNKSTKVLTYTSSTWIWDDGADWVTTGATGATILVEQRYSRNEYTATIKTTTDALNDDGSYKVDTKTQKFTYDRDFSTITVPTKKGYDFGGYKVVGGTYDGELIWDASGKKTKSTWLWAENVTVEAVWTARTYTIEYAKGSFTITYDQAIPTVTTDGKDGHTFKGYALNSDLGGAKVFGSDGKPTTTLWRYDIGANGTKTKLDSLFDINYYTVTVDYAGEFPEERLGTAYGSKSGKITVPTKTGYVLEGFVAKGTDKFLFDATGAPMEDYYVHGDQTVTPVWRAKKYIIRTNTGWTTEITYGEKTPVFNGNTPTQEYSDFLGFFRGAGVIIRTDGTFVQNPWMTDLGPDGTVINLNAKFTDPIYPEEKEIEEVTEEESEEPSEEPSEEHPFEPVEKTSEIEKDNPEVKGNQKIIEFLKTAAPYVGITAGVVIFFGAAAAAVLMILFVLGRIAMLYKIPLNGSPKFAQFVFVETMRNYERSGLTKFRVKMPKKYFGIMSSNLDSTTLQIKLSKPFVIKNVGQKVIIGYNNLAAEYEVSDIIEV